MTAALRCGLSQDSAVVLEAEQQSRDQPYPALLAFRSSNEAATGHTRSRRSDFHRVGGPRIIGQCLVAFDRKRGEHALQ